MNGKEFRAWRVECDDVVVITFAKSRSAAKYNALASAREAGFYQRGRNFPSRLQAWRAKQYDYSHLKENCAGNCWSEDFVKTE